MSATPADADKRRLTIPTGTVSNFADWRFNIRMSNTEPVVRLNVESRGDRKLMEARTAEILQLMGD